jgi:hypothetical protein
MPDDSLRQSALFPELLDRPLQAAFDDPAGTSDGGAILLKALDQKLSLTEAMVAALADRRQPGKVRHSLHDLIRQRVYGLACGYEDANDAGRLAADPLHKLLVDRDPFEGDDLASQSTLSRFENSVRPAQLFRAGMAIAETLLTAHKRQLGRKVRRIVVDLDPTDDPAHGAQQGVLFNGFYDTWCYLPLLVFVSYDRAPEPQLLAAILRPGKAHPTDGTLCVLRQLLPRLRQLHPKARILVRLDGGFLAPAVLGFLDAQPRTDYVVGLPKNKVLVRKIEDLMVHAIAASHREKRTVSLFGEINDYAAKSWRKTIRRVIAKAEVVVLDGREPRPNPRFVVTDLRHTPRHVYDIYCDRGEVENRIKELKHGLAIDRTSCHRFVANQMRLLLTTIAYALMQDLRRRVALRSNRRPQVESLRLMLLKIGARIERSARRFVVHFAENHVWKEDWLRVAATCGAT